MLSPPSQPYLGDWVDIFFIYRFWHILRPRVVKRVVNTEIHGLVFFLSGDPPEVQPGGMIKISVFFSLHIIMIRPRRYSVDLKQGPLELPANFCFYFAKRKTIFSNEIKDIGRGAEVWVAKEKCRGRKRKEKETQKRKKNKNKFFPF